MRTHKYLLIKKNQISKFVFAEVEASSVLEACVKAGWPLNQVKIKVFRNGHYQDPRTDDWLPCLGPETLQELRLISD
jgi:hypothetical protein